ncbi:MAG TPA: patatin-like phospholipase family protein [Bryobacteraceae bacterium]|nr:patatin-like phospholipase family protein [Bryobacteraceae bacterium]
MRIGVALGGGFARGIAHVGVLRVLEAAGVTISGIAGISAGAIVAAAYASGRALDEIAATASTMRFSHVARWCVPRLGLADNRRMCTFLKTLLRSHRFEDMRIPLSVVATDLITGAPTVFHTGDVIDPIRASCAYPGLLEPVPIEGRPYVDGAIGMEVPTAAIREMNVNKVIAVRLLTRCNQQPANFFQVINRCFLIMNEQSETAWRSGADLVIEPDVSDCAWDGFASSRELIAAGEQAARAALPAVREWLEAPDFNSESQAA